MVFMLEILTLRVRICYNTSNTMYNGAECKQKPRKEVKKSMFIDEKTDLEIVRKFFTKDKFVALAGIEIDAVSETEATVSARIDERHQNANGCVQGGMLYTLADFAFAVLSNYTHPATVTQAGNISYLRPALGGRITATAREVERAGHNTVCEVVIKDDTSQTVAVAHFNGFVKDIDKKELWEKLSK